MIRFPGKVVFISDFVFAGSDAPIVHPYPTQTGSGGPNRLLMDMDARWERIPNFGTKPDMGLHFLMENEEK